MKKVSILLACFVFLIGLSGSASAWWNDNWDYRKQITITNNHNSDALPEGYTVNITLDTTGSKFMDNGDDVRIIYSGSGTDIELDRINVTAFNDSITVILFRTQAIIPASGSNDSYWVYYGNPSAGTPPANGSNVYLFYDDFNSYNNDINHPLFTERWSRWWWNGQCIPLIHDNLLSLDCAQGPVRSDGYMTTTNFPSNIAVEFDYTSAGTHYFPLYYFRINTSTTGICQWTSYKLLEYAVTYAPPGDSKAHMRDAYSDSVFCPERGSYDFVPNVSQTYRIKHGLFGSSWSLYIDNVLMWNSSVLWTGGGRFGLRAYSDSNGGVHMHTDNIVIRKYISPEPTTSLGEEEDIFPDIEIWTDKTNYTTGDTMYVGLNLSNPGGAITVGIYIWVDLPSGGKKWVVQKPSVTLPAGLEYGNPSWMSFTLPSITPGDYAWHAVLYDPVKAEIISESIAPWTFSSSIAGREEAIEKALRRAPMDIDFEE